MENPQDFDALAADTIRHEIVCSGHHQLTRTGSPAGTPETGMIGQRANGVFYQDDNPGSGLRVILRNVVSLFLEVEQRAA